MIETTGDIRRLDTIIEESSKIVITAHIHPDGDAAGCTLAMRQYLASRGKDAVVVYPEPLPETIRFISEGDDPSCILSGTGDPGKAAEAVRNANLIFCMDCNSFTRTGVLEPLMRESGAVKVLIDHHLDPEKEAFTEVFSKTDISSASELLYSILLSMPDIAGKPENLPGTAGRCLMTGMTTDTNNFANSVYPSTFAMASALLAAGVDRDAILARLFNEYRENRLRLMGHLLSENMRITPWGVAYMIVDEGLAAKYGIAEGETEGFVNMPLAMGKVKMSIFLKVDGNGFFRVSVRSKQGYSSNKCATRYFHGGGHELASGGRLFYPQDVAVWQDAAGYIERVTEELFKEEGYYVE